VKAAPVVKWVGGKTKLLPEILTRAPSRFGRYYEPFAGGAALFFALAPERAVLGDANADLISMYRTLVERPEAVIGVLGRLEEMHSEEHYYRTREEFNARTGLDPHDRAAAFIYLNKTCFNGLWRVNRRGSMNSPLGRTASGKPPTICDADALRAAAGLLAGTTLRSGDFRDTVRDAGRGDFVYLDPPYDPPTPTASFTSYTAGAFGRDAQHELAETARGLVARGCHVLLSNSDTPFIRDLYRGFRIDRVKCARAINSNAAARGAVDEVIVIGEPAARRARTSAQLQLQGVI
jgi:DNA adenine methylase